MSDSENVRQRLSELSHVITELSKELAMAWTSIGKLEQTVSVYGDQIDTLRNKVYALEHDTPQARQLQYEADVAAADLAASGYRDYEEW